jgi:hypothetical protein
MAWLRQATACFSRLLISQQTIDKLLLRITMRRHSRGIGAAIIFYHIEKREVAWGFTTHYARARKHVG